MIQKDNQHTLTDQLFHPEKQNTKTATFLDKMDRVFDWILNGEMCPGVAKVPKSGYKRP